MIIIRENLIIHHRLAPAYRLTIIGRRLRRARYIRDSSPGTALSHDPFHVTPYHGRIPGQVYFQCFTRQFPEPAECYQTPGLQTPARAEMDEVAEGLLRRALTPCP